VASGLRESPRVRWRCKKDRPKGDNGWYVAYKEGAFTVSDRRHFLVVAIADFAKL
jgi:hypothetical protein